MNSLRQLSLITPIMSHSNSGFKKKITLPFLLIFFIDKGSTFKKRTEILLARKGDSFFYWLVCNALSTNQRAPFILFWLVEWTGYPEWLNLPQFHPVAKNGTQEFWVPGSGIRCGYSRWHLTCKNKFCYLVICSFLEHIWITHCSTDFFF